MSQNDSSSESINLPATPTPPVLPSDRLPALVQYEDKKEPPAATAGFKIEQIFVFVLFIILLILFSTNPIVFSSLTGLLTLLTIGALENVSNKIIEYIGKPFNWIIRPFVWLFHSIFASPNGLRRHRRFITNTIIAIILVSTLAMTTLQPLLSSAVVNVNDYLCLKQTLLPWKSCNSGLGTEQIFNNVTIGMTEDGSNRPFDQSSLNGSEQQVESLIFADNATACATRHITIAVVTMLSRTVEDPSADATIGTEDLQGAYLAQHGYNSQHPQTQLCLAIANLGTIDTANTALPLIIHQLEQLARSDPNFHGIMGFPFSQQAQDAMQKMQASKQLQIIPVVSPSASSNQLSNLANFYRMVSPDQSQGQILAQFFCHDLEPRNPGRLDIFTDSTNPYSHSLQQSFEDSVNCQLQPSIINYRDGNAATINDAVQTAINDNAKYIFFPGYNSDLDTLQLAIRAKERNNAKNITIIGGDALYDLDGTATNNNYSVVYSTTFASPLRLHSTSTQINTFISAYQQSHFAQAYLATTIPDYILLSSHIILSYDATNAFIQSLQKTGNPPFTQENFNTTLSSIVFTGVSGEIELMGDGNNPLHISDRNKGEIYITCADQSYNIHIITEYQSTINADAVNVNRISPSGPLCVSK